MSEHLKLMYITNRPDVAHIAENAGVDRIFVDMEHIGKSLRQGGMDTVQSRHTVYDIQQIRRTLKRAQLLVRVNPIHKQGADWGNSKQELDAVLEHKPDLVMLPYFKTLQEVETFVKLVDGRAKTVPLVETKEAAQMLDEILQVGGIDEIYIGLNDLSLSYGLKFMFQPLADGMIDKMAEKIHRKGIPFGFGGLASMDKGMLPGEHVLMEHYRLGSSSVILSRSFCNVAKQPSVEAVERVFYTGVGDIRQREKFCLHHPELYEDNKLVVQQKVSQILNDIGRKQP